MKKTLYLAIVFMSGMLSYHWISNQISGTYKNLTIESVSPESKDLSEYAVEMIRNPIIQSAPALCGAASLEAVMRSLGLDSLDQKGILEQSGSLNYWGVYFGGMTLDELAVLASEMGLTAQAYRPSTLIELRQALSELSSPQTRIIANYSRVPLTGENIGHHTPIVSYDSISDTVVLQDVTEGYGSYSIPVAVLFTAVMTPDSETSLQRGLVMIRQE